MHPSPALPAAAQGCTSADTPFQQFLHLLPQGFLTHKSSILNSSLPFLLHSPVCKTIWSYIKPSFSSRLLVDATGSAERLKTTQLHSAAPSTECSDLAWPLPSVCTAASSLLPSTGGLLSHLTFLPPALGSLLCNCHHPLPP
jgi:hypothetical protein